MDSSFKYDLQQIYNQCRENHVRSTNSHPSSASKANKSAQQWLAYLNQRCIPTVAIWSNLLLGIYRSASQRCIVLFPSLCIVGNMSRYVTSSVRAFNRLLLNTHNQRTNAISERRMAIVKRTQLGRNFGLIKRNHNHFANRLAG